MGSEKPSSYAQKALFEDLRPRPRIIPRSQHPISRKNMDREALKVLYRLKDHGYLAYLVGGSVRDLLLGKRPKDFDIGTDARPEEVRRLFRYSRIIGKRFRIVHVYFRGGKVIEVSTFRRQTDYDDREAGRLGIDESALFGTPEEDAFRRDLTINGLFYNIADFTVIDYVGGMADLKAGVIRAIGDPERRFLRDPVRIMRTLRHAARTGFTIEPRTWEAAKAHADKVMLCSLARVRDEWLKDINSAFAAPWLEYLFKSGLFQHLFPGCARAASRPEVRRLLLELMSRVDRLTREGRELSEQFRIAALLYPIASSDERWEGLRSPRLRWPTYEVRLMVEELLRPYEFGRGARDTISQILSNQFPLALSHEKRSLPKRVWKKTVFKEALLLYNLVQEALGRERLEVVWRGEAPVLKEGKKRGRRRRKRRSRKK